jgi:Arc/MetJ family transcription regulator
MCMPAALIHNFLAEMCLTLGAGSLSGLFMHRPSEKMCKTLSRIHNPLGKKCMMSPLKPWRNAMRINVEVDEQLMMKALQLTGLPTYKQALNEALSALVGLYEQGEVRGLRGTLHRQPDLVRERRSR